jgi:hypothetical protein
MATKFDISTLLEDGPELPAQIAAWLEIGLAPLTILLDQMQIPACARCGRCFVPSAGRTGWYCSRECDEAETISSCAASHGPSERDADGMGRPHPDAITVNRPRSSAPRREDPEFDIVWSGIGPLPGAGGAAGLGSTLSGIHFSIGRRG